MSYYGDENNNLPLESNNSIESDKHVPFLERYVNKFPFFLDRSNDSNNYKHHEVTGDALKDINQIVKELQVNKELDKPIEIWKVQNIDHDYAIYFGINVPIDEIEFKKNDTSIEPMQIDEGLYVYNGTSEHIIPDDDFTCIVTSGDYTFEKEMKDKDPSLDQIGKLLNIPRKEYREVFQADYPYTEPAYNALDVEIDYHYANRMQEFCENLHTKPLPLLYLKAWLGIDGDLQNRESKLMKMCHGDVYGNLPTRDSPMPWEHRDQACDGSTDDLLFNFSLNTKRPLTGTTLKARFQFLDVNGNSRTLSGVVVPYFNGMNTESLIIQSTTSWDVNTADLPSEEFSIRFKYFDSYQDASNELTISGGAFIESGLYTDPTVINIIGYDSADIYVSSTGNDTTGDGSADNPYATVSKAATIALDEEIIGLMKGTIQDGNILARTNFKLLGLDTTTPPKIEATNRRIMDIGKVKDIVISNITFKNSLGETTLENDVFNNESTVTNSYLVSKEQHQ